MAPIDYPDYYGRMREKGEETLYYRLDVVLAAGATQTLFQLIGEDVDLQFLELGANDKSIRLLMYGFDKNGSSTSVVQLAKKEGSSDTSITPENINTHGSQMFHEIFYDTTNNYYKFGLASLLRYSNGLEIRINNPLGTSINVVIIAIVLIRG